MTNFINRCLHDGATSVSRDVLTSLPIPPVPFRPWEVGCLIHIPEDCVLLMQNFCLPNGGEGHVPFIVVEVHFPDGTRAFDKAFLNVFTKACRPAGSRNFATTHGTAVDFIRSFPNWCEAIEGLRGMTLKVTADDAYETLSPNGEFARIVHIYGFDLCA